jgi:hypothetical protein
MRKLHKLLIFIFCLTSVLPAIAQTPLKQINIISFNVKSKLPADVSTWGSIPAGLLLVAQKLPQVNVQGIKLVLQIKQAGARICGSNVDASTLIDINNVRNFSGNELVGYLSQCPTLRPGNYIICAQFFNIDRYPISEERCKDFVVEDQVQVQQSYSAPLNIAPVNQKKFSANEQNAPITFRWTPLVPKPRDQVTYRLKVWQLMQGQTGSQAMRSNTPIVEKDVVNITQTVITNLYTGPCRPPYLCDFVWNVQALDKDGKPLGNNNGTSELSSWSWGATQTSTLKLLAPENKSVLTPSENAPINFRWTPLVPKPQQPVTYRLKVWQLMQGQNSTQAMRTNKPIVTKDVADITETSIANIYTGPCRPPYLCDYVWMVEAIGEQEKLLGNTEPSSFKFGSTATVAACCPGTWGSIQTGLSSTSLTTTLAPGFGLLPSMPSGTTFFINTCYTCGAGCGTPSIMYQLQNSSSGAIISGPTVGTNCATTAFTIPTGLSSSVGYVFKIFAYCGGVICDSSAYQFTPIAVSCCTGSSWGAMQWCVNTPCVLAPMPPCNGTLGSLAASSIVNFNMTFNCAPGCATAQILYNIYDNAGNLYSTTTGASATTTGVSIPSVPGNYSFTLYGVCGGVRCDSCKYQFIVTSCCAGSSWGPKNWGNTSTPPPSNPLPACNTNVGTINCSVTKYFNVTFNCAPGCGPSQILYNIYNSSGSLVSSVTSASGATAAVVFPATAGSYFMKIFAQCGSQNCDSCIYKFVTTCTNCCVGSSWGPKFYRPAPLPILPWQTLPCSSTLLPMHQSSITKFRVFYNCPPGCGPAKIQYIINGPSGYTWTSPLVPSGTIVNAPMPPTIGVASVTINAFCSGVLCNTCIDKFTIVP